MFKKIVAGTCFIGLIVILILNITNYNESQNQEEKSNVIEVTGDSSVKGTTIISPDKPNGIDIGETAPDFTLLTIDGKEVSLSDFRGKKVFLNFWATWCGPCKIEMPEMQKIQENYEDEVEIIAVNATGDANETVDAVEKFLSQGNFSFTVLLDPKSEVTDAYKLIGIPTTYFIGTDGEIQSEKVIGPMTYELMEEKIDELN
ncbi:TlpA family protein disulfide reductase [Aquibacillus rhizosphaerae]|uniref:Redoxin domain-containing protein n=1 Tax=Aquibacillus rhizosphaerae TaxID=3051431 RepID=A0ABT7L118_9BACI|nr:redoxin domain-containing protein [Aquibacillus sp. LR5S19]MDL4839547.1 redoxin domain-containing protein [Aquibacillus sp. LR5S19]